MPIEKKQVEPTWEQMTYKEKNHQLFLRQKKLLQTFLDHKAISKEQYEKSLNDLEEKMLK